MRVALVGPAAPPAGGMAAQRAQLATRLRADGLTVIEVVTNPPHPPAVAQLRGVRAAVRLLPYLARVWHAAGRADVMHVMANSGWAWHLMAAPAVWLARLRGVPVVVSYHGGQAGEFLAAQSRWVLPTLKRARTVVVPSGFLQAVFAHWAMPTQVIPDSIDLARFTAPLRPRGGAHIVFTRNLEAVYDPASALAAFARVLAVRADARLTLAGSGPLEASLRAQTAALGIAHAVTFAGRLSAAGVAALLVTADALVNPSLADNMPNSVLEALAAGVPVVSTAVGGVPYLVADGVSALLTPVRDVPALAAALLRVIEEAPLAHTLIANGQRLAARHDWRAVGAAWRRLYR